jgi:hypothetical protein
MIFDKLLRVVPQFVDGFPTMGLGRKYIRIRQNKEGNCKILKVYLYYLAK